MPTRAVSFFGPNCAIAGSPEPATGRSWGLASGGLGNGLGPGEMAVAGGAAVGLGVVGRAVRFGGNRRMGAAGIRDGREALFDGGGGAARTVSWFGSLMGGAGDNWKIA